MQYVVYGPAAELPLIAQNVNAFNIFQVAYRRDAIVGSVAAICCDNIPQSLVPLLLLLRLLTKYQY